MSQLGWIPDVQFSADPRKNPFINAAVSMPPGMYQAGVYTVQPAYAPALPLVNYKPEPTSYLSGALSGLGLSNVDFSSRNVFIATVLATAGFAYWFIKS